ncbi:MAG: V-type ATP synthase subunit E [Betaproteobacteria bacterium]|nr:V-type ATP synthase subunit E [Betaproteobacteria bacterium]
MSSESQVRELEAALLARARALVHEHLKKAAEERERILAECGSRLHLREEKEILAAKADADRLYRQRVQAAEIRLQGELDRLRWTLVQAAMDQVKTRLAALAGDEKAYLPVLAGYLAQACRSIGEPELVAELNALDHQRLAPRWEAFAREAAPGQRVTLHPVPCNASGGVIVRDAASRVRIDNSFEGRLERLQEQLHHAVLAQLFATVPDMETLFHG